MQVRESQPMAPTMLRDPLALALALDGMLKRSSQQHMTAPLPFQTGLDRQGPCHRYPDSYLLRLSPPTPSQR